jgi:hypothetical protein
MPIYQSVTPTKPTAGSNGVLATRKIMGTNATSTLLDLVKAGGAWMTIRDAIRMGYLVHSSPFGPTDVADSNKVA